MEFESKYDKLLDEANLNEWFSLTDGLGGECHYYKTEFGRISIFPSIKHYGNVSKWRSGVHIIKEDVIISGRGYEGSSLDEIKEKMMEELQFISKIKVPKRSTKG